VVSPSIPPGGLAEGQTLAGKYRVHRTLGAGGMCFVYEAEHVHLKQAVALKLLKPELAKDPTAVQRFAQEAQAAAKLRSPNVARVYDVDTLPDGQPYITMELLLGHDLGTELERRFSLPIQVAVDFVIQAANGISEAHMMGIVHRDLKPENLFLTELGPATDRRLLKILDFGIAKNVHEAARKLTSDDSVFGTVDYMSPEQIRSASTVDHRTDLWSLGVILYELVTGRTPFGGDARAVIAQIVTDPVLPPTHFVPTLPPGLVNVIMRALQKDPNTRFQTADELKNALLPFMNGVEPITSLLTRLPPASIPRRQIEPARIGDPRDARTNLAFETGSSKAKRAWIVPIAGAAAIGVLGFVLWKKNVLAPHQIPAAPPPPAPSFEPALPPPEVAPPVAPTVLGASPPPDPPPSSAVPSHKPRPRPTARPAPTPSETAAAPAATGAASALPKHL
jgi:eukaryotic-like serine/threonine-protein kinase